MSVPAMIVDGWTLPSEVPLHRTTLKVEGVRIGDPYLEVAIHKPTESGPCGPCVDLTSDQARRLADVLRARADLIDAVSHALAEDAKTSEVPF